MATDQGVGSSNLLTHVINPCKLQFYKGFYVLKYKANFVEFWNNINGKVEEGYIIIKKRNRSAPCKTGVKEEERSLILIRVKMYLEYAYEE